MATFTFYLEDLESENDDSLISCVDAVVAVGVVRIIFWIVWRHQTTTGS